jgi:ribosome-binding ATPase YchF (GTP1/OBG family)
MPDPRLAALSTLYRPRKTTPAQITFGDISGMGEDGTVPAQWVNELAHWDGMLVVLRAFENPFVTQPVDPTRDLSRIEEELLLNDLLRTEARLERLPEERQKGARPRAELDREILLFERLAETLRASRPLRELELSAAERVSLLAHNLLTLKPLLPVQNLEEAKPAGPLSTELHWVPFYGKLELELAQLPEAEARDFRAEFGIQDSGLSRLLQACLELLGRMIFFTVSEPEVKAWPLARGGTALEAVGTIHSDMARGFIRAEVIAWDRLVDLGGLAQARAAGKLRLEGKDYPVADGEVIYVRFNV